MRLPAAVIGLLCLVLVAGCGGGDDGGPTREPGGTPQSGATLAAPGEGSLILSNLNELIERDLESGSTASILTADDANEFFLDPAVSRDGRQIAFIRQPPPAVIDGRFDGGSDLWLVNRDGSGARPLFEHVDANQLIRFPRWESATAVLAIVQEITTQNDITNVVYTLQRIDIETGERERVLDDVLSFDISPDGQQLVYSKLLPNTGEVLASVGVEASVESVLVGPDQLLVPFGYPRFSPDGTTVAFASADQTGAYSPQVEFVSLRLGEAGEFEATSAVTVDGLPQDVWTIEAAGGRAVRVADLKEDLPALTWDGSGERIYVIGVSALYDINLRTGGVDVIGDGAFHAQISWAPDVGD